MKIKLEDLGFHDFNLLKQMGMLWELYPEAPEFHHEIEKEAPVEDK